MPTSTVQGRVAHYREWGQGPQLILMLHGWPANSADYAELAPILAQSGFRVIVPDLPGWGQTPPPPTAWSVSDYMRWVQAFVESLSLPPYILFGHSFGGRISIKYVLQYPYQVRGLVLCAAAGIKPNPYTVKRRLLKRTAKAGQAVFSIPGFRVLAPYARKLLYRAAGSTDYLQAEGVMKETIVKVLDEDLSPLLAEIRHPTLLLWGSEDGATPLSDGEGMAKHIPHASLHVFEGARHNLPKQHPALVAEKVIAFANSDTVRAISEQ